MRRRQFLGLVGGIAAQPSVLNARQPAIPVVGFLNPRSADDSVGLAAAFRQSLNDVGFSEGHNVAVEYRWAFNQNDRLPFYAVELAGRRVNVIAAFSTAAALTTKAATAEIPIVFLTGDDPVEVGIVPSIARPIGNITGVTFASSTLASKRLQLIRALVPREGTIAVLVDPGSSEGVNHSKGVADAARGLGLRYSLFEASSASQIETAFAELLRRGAGAVLVSGSPLFLALRGEIVSQAGRSKLPCIYTNQEYVKMGGLISYGASIQEGYRQAGLYVGRILRGSKPPDLPILQPTKFELVINLKTAKEMDLDVPPTLLALADEVLE